MVLVQVTGVFLMVQPCAGKEKKDNKKKLFKSVADVLFIVG